MKPCLNCGHIPPDDGRASNQKINPDHYPEIERLYLDQGLTLAEIGDRYGVTRERIRQILPPQIAKTRRARRQNRIRTKAFLSTCQRALDENLVCSICHGWILRKTGNVTCSPECRKAADTLRTFDNHEHHRRQLARSILAHPDRHPALNLEWAEAMLEPDPPPPNRRYFRPGSKRSELIRKYRPEAYAAITENQP